MCGITGWINIAGGFNKQTFYNMTNVIRHRGPDDEGYTFVTQKDIHHLSGKDTKVRNLIDINGFNDDASVFLAFGHRRLSIIDLSVAAHQPFSSDDESVILTFNGEIYNYLELREELREKGYCFSTTSDTEVLMKAYLEWGEECVDHFNGMWAFAIWDTRLHRIFCSRDRLGAKPFFYYKDDENFIFGSEMKQICQNPVVDRKINDEALTNWIMWRFTDYSQDTLIKEIYSLQGGYNLSMEIKEDHSFGDMVISQYWDLDINSQKDSKAVREALRCHEDAVKIRMRSDVPIGVLLSGGLDSSVLTAEISENTKNDGKDAKEVNTFTSCYKNYEQADEKKVC